MNGPLRPPAVEWKGVRFRYAGAGGEALRGVDLAVAEGEFVLLTGPTGCGKSTLLRTANGLIPRESAGRLEGAIRLFGQDAAGLPSPLLRSWAGLLFQNPGDQLLCARVQEEVAFGPENLGEPPEAIAARVEEALASAAVSEKRLAKCQELSGGEKQRVALAGILALRPRLLVLDEPTSQLDERGAGEVLRSLAGLRDRLRPAVIIAEHRIDRILPLADRLVVMDGGAVRGIFPKGRFIEALPLLRDLGLEIPLWMELAERAKLENAEGEDEVCRRLAASGARVRLPEANGRPAASAPLLRFGGIRHAHAKAAPRALEAVSAELGANEILALMGHNGSGKTTLLSLLAGLAPLQAGEVRWFGEPPAPPSALSLAGRVGFLFQNPDLMLTAETVRGELELGPRLLGRPPARAEEAVARSMAFLGLGALADRNPFSLSQGERLRLALGALLACEPRVLLLDEPTAGLDRGTRVRLLKDLHRWVKAEGEERAMILCTHDAEAALEFADRGLVLQAGRVAACGPIEEVMDRAGRGELDGFLPSPVARAARRLGAPSVPRSREALLQGIAHA